MPTWIALLGAQGSDASAMLEETLAARLRGTPLRAQAIHDETQWRSALASPPARVLLLAPVDSAGEAQGQRWRALLAEAGVDFSVLHGDARARSESAWQLVQPLLGELPSQPQVPRGSKRWAWSCEKCSDPACEHQLFQDLIRGRAPGGQ